VWAIVLAGGEGLRLRPLTQRIWSTSIFVARTSLLIEVAGRLLPGLHERLERIWAFAGTEDEPWAVQQAYALAPVASFSRAILEAAPALLAVRALPPSSDATWGRRSGSCGWWSSWGSGLRGSLRRPDPPEVGSSVAPAPDAGLGTAGTAVKEAR